MLSLVAHTTPVPGLVRLQRVRHHDARGSFGRIFCAGELHDLGWRQPIAQINVSSTSLAGTIRGLHFQRPPAVEMKVVTCLRGEVWDVVVDLRAGSPTYLRWHAEHLSAADGDALLVPAGCAHGFQTLTDDVELVYCHSASYTSSAEDALRFDDPALAIPWPLPVRSISERDQSHPWMTEAFRPVVLS